MTKRLPALLPLTATLMALGGYAGACQANAQTAESRITYFSNTYRICQGQCPQLTDKRLDVGDQIANAPAQRVNAGNKDDAQRLEQLYASNKSQTATNNAITAAPERIFAVLFEFDSDKPTPNGRIELNALLQAAQSTNAIVELQGNTDDIGAKDYNDKLAFRRVHYVAAYLKTRGVNTKISVEAKGECCHPGPYNKAEKSLLKMRRVTAKVQPTHQGGTSNNKK